MKKHIFTWHLNVSQLQFFACTRDDGRSENVRGIRVSIYIRSFDTQQFLLEKTCKLVHVVLYVNLGHYFGMMSQNFGMKIYHYLLF